MKVVYFMLAPVNSLAIGECGALWAWNFSAMAASIWRPLFGRMRKIKG
jgi:hypothetical protein